uniref:Uncharacterized protein n=1 Tax=Cacopsylla melanoneura TaxID=428564 RepID=A0A8D8SAD1_9HEMI
MMLPIFSVGREVTIETTESPLSHGSCTPTSTPFNNGPECTSTPVPPLENDSQSTDGASQGNDSHSTDALVPETTPKKGRKRKKNEGKWKKNVRKANRNLGKSYKQSSKKQKDKIRPERQLKSACGKKCRYKCSEIITDEERKALFQEYWNLGDVERQRDYLAHCMSDVTPKCEYRRIKVNGSEESEVISTRKPNTAYSFMKEGTKVRVCKLFFEKTLDINPRPINTVKNKRDKVAGVLQEKDLRGKHGKHKKLDQTIIDGIKQHIESIPKIESHYTRAKTSKLFIDGSKTITDIHRDYVSKCETEGKPYANYQCSLFYFILKI